MLTGAFLMWDIAALMPAVPGSYVADGANALNKGMDLQLFARKADNAEEILSNIKYTNKVKWQKSMLDDYHSFPWIVDKYGEFGIVDKVTDVNGISHTRIKIPGGYKGKEGYFEYIIDSVTGDCNHRMFISSN